MNTSYFGRKSVWSNVHAISIAVGFPKGWNPHRRYPLLTPSIELLLAFQKGNVTWE